MSRGVSVAALVAAFAVAALPAYSAEGSDTPSHATSVDIADATPRGLGAFATATVLSHESDAESDAADGAAHEAASPLESELADPIAAQDAGAGGGASSGGQASSGGGAPALAGLEWRAADLSAVKAEVAAYRSSGGRAAFVAPYGTCVDRGPFFSATSFGIAAGQTHGQNLIANNGSTLRAAPASGGVMAAEFWTVDVTDRSGTVRPAQTVGGRVYECGIPTPASSGDVGFPTPTPSPSPVIPPPAPSPPPAPEPEPSPPPAGEAPAPAP